MSYLTASQIAYNVEFRARVVFGLIDVAKDKAIDPLSTADDKTFAAKVLNDPEKIGRMMAYMVALLLNNINALDADIKTAVETIWPYYIYVV